MNVSRPHLLAALRFLDGPDGGAAGTPPGDNGTPPAGDNAGKGGGDNGDRGSGDDADPEDADKGDRQARRDENIRAKLKDTETAREALATKVEKLQRREVERVAGGVLAQAADLFEVGGVKLEDVLTEDGEIDEAEVLGMAAALVDQRPGLSKHAEIPRGRHPDWGHSRTATEIGGTGTTWGEALIRREGSSGR